MFSRAAAIAGLTLLAVLSLVNQVNAGSPDLASSDAGATTPMFPPTQASGGKGLPYDCDPQHPGAGNQCCMHAGVSNTCDQLDSCCGSRCMPLSGTCCSEDSGYWTYGICPYSDNDSNTGVIAGAVIGTVACLLIITCIIILCRRHYHRHHHHTIVAQVGYVPAPATTVVTSDGYYANSHVPYQAAPVGGGIVYAQAV